MTDNALESMKSEAHQLYFKLGQIDDGVADWVSVERLAERLRDLAVRIQHRERSLATLEKMKTENRGGMDPNHY